MQSAFTNINERMHGCKELPGFGNRMPQFISEFFSKHYSFLDISQSVASGIIAK